MLKHDTRYFFLLFYSLNGLEDFYKNYETFTNTLYNDDNKLFKQYKGNTFTQSDHSHV